MDIPAAENGKDRHLDARALRFAIILPVLMSAGLVGGGLLLGGGPAGGTIPPLASAPVPFPVFLAMGVGLILVPGIGVGAQGARTVLPRQLRRILLGLAVTLQMSAVSFFAAALVGQTSQGGLPTEPMDAQVALMGTGLACAMGVVLALTFKPDEQWGASDDAALSELLAIEADPTVANDRLAYAIHPRSSVVIMILLAGLLPGAVLTILSPWFLLALPLLAVLGIAGLSATVHMDRRRLSVKLAGLVPVILVPCTDVDGAVSLDIKAGDYGGWGLRRHSGSESFLAYSGAGVVLRTEKAGRVVVNAPNLDTADDLAAILNRRAGKDAGQH
ncbi:hypothetical protein [Arthrobacter sp. A2-55]|uniref:hypothetical protein n=1 Tax=Arthrobacter sp. A2-55 TaxID=2897337 RepID=UPI0021CD5F8B|nr:hypothetical protein [Arthrobacter sp. A2-55]MCU6481837.1 hypothetical protein [Arthrobacter sp. A2-55]